MQGMHIRQTVTCFSAAITLHKISEIAAGLSAVRWKIIGSKSKSKVDLVLRWERHDHSALRHRVFLISFRISCQSTFPLVRIAKRCELIRQFTGANYPPICKNFSFDNATVLVCNAEVILRADSGVALVRTFRPVPIWKSKILVVPNFLQNEHTHIDCYESQGAFLTLSVIIRLLLALMKIRAYGSKALQ